MIDIEAVKARPRTDKEMSNFDRTIDKGLEEDLRNGMRGTHAAARFFGQYVWFDNDTFYEQVWVFGEPAAVCSSDSLEDLLRLVNDQFGWQ
jgi:hypothetical protein